MKTMIVEAPQGAVPIFIEEQQPLESIPLLVEEVATEEAPVSAAPVAPVAHEKSVNAYGVERIGLSPEDPMRQQAAQFAVVGLRRVAEAYSPAMLQALIEQARDGAALLRRANVWALDASFSSYYNVIEAAEAKLKHL